MKDCCIFSCSSPEVAWKQFEFEVIERFGDTFRNHDGTCEQDIRRLDDGRCSFIRCKNCGALFVYYFSETLVSYGSGDDIYFTYRGLYSVATRDEALQYSAAYNGTSIKIDLGGLKICENNGRWTWNNNEHNINT